MNQLELLFTLAIFTVAGWLFVIWRVHFRAPETTHSKTVTDYAANNQHSFTHLTALDATQPILISSDLYDKARIAAALSGMNFNEWISQTIIAGMAETYQIQDYADWLRQYHPRPSPVRVNFLPTTNSIEDRAYEEATTALAKKIRSA